MNTLLDRPPLVKGLSPDQLAMFNHDTLWVRELGAFSVSAAVEQLAALEGQGSIGVDIGGDKMAAEVFAVHNGLMVPTSGLNIEMQSKGGKGYMARAVNLAGIAQELLYGVGVSYAGPLDGTKPLYGENVSTFFAELQEEYDGDLSKLFKMLRAIGNDAVSGLIESSVRIEKANPGMATNVIYLINGSGVGGAVKIGDMIYALEPGHVKALERFNPYGRKEICGMNGADFTCVELVAATKAGVEATFFEQTGYSLGGKKIEELALAGNDLALNLYDNSALLLAHTLDGITTTFGIEPDPEKTSYVGHGGSFKFGQYVGRLKQYMSMNGTPTENLITTYDFSNNACMAGAATMAALELQF